MLRPSTHRQRTRRLPAARNLIVVLTLALAAAGVGALSASAQNGNENNITLCHGTGSETNPYVVITVDDDAIENQITGPNGHGQHIGPIFPETLGPPENWGDIIPAFTVGNISFPGLNNTPEGLAILENNCQLVTPPPTQPPPTQPPETAPPRTAPPAPPGPAAAPPAPAAPSAAAPVAGQPRTTG